MLTRREFQVYMLIVERAWSHRLIAESIGCKYWTVIKHVQSIMDKTGCSTTLELLTQYHKREMNF